MYLHNIAVYNRQGNGAVATSYGQITNVLRITNLPNFPIYFALLLLACLGRKIHVICSTVGHFQL